MIFSLSPGFLFHTVPASERLDRTDAQFVDVLHSAGLWIGSDEVVTSQFILFTLVVNFSSILHVAFTHADPKSAKNTV
jgi:hypothetical protein